MALPRRDYRFTLEQYLEWELAHDEKFEYADGLIVAMAGGSPRHNRVAVRASTILENRFGDRCSVYNSDQRVATVDGLHTYPDASVVCGTPEFTTYQGTGTLHNPSLLVEVLSPSTRNYDLGDKLAHYQTIPSLREVLLIDPDTVDVRHVRRTAEGWETRRFRAIEDVIDLAEGTLPLAEIYARVLEEGR